MQLPLSSGYRRCRHCAKIAVIGEFYGVFIKGKKTVDSWCKECRKDSAKKSRLEAIAAYGGLRCRCCGVEEPVFLAIDHIDPNSKLPGTRRSKIVGWRFYAWLKRKGFPPGFQVLCHNCNWAKHALGRCPHQPALSDHPAS